MPAPVKKPVAAKPPCRHLRLHFDQGGLHLVCEDCPTRWAAVISPFWIIQDVMARGQGLSELDKRYDPSASPVSKL